MQHKLHVKHLKYKTFATTQDSSVMKPSLVIDLQKLSRFHMATGSDGTALTQSVRVRIATECKGFPLTTICSSVIF